jgi:hypothetical protein
VTIASNVSPSASSPARIRGVPRVWWAAAVLALVSWLVYQPALNRVFVMDQVWYFAELGGSTSLADGLRHYDYAATRQYWRGDDALFRPLLFAWLAVGNALFSYHHVAWNVASLVMHVLVAVALFQLLVAIRPSPFALPVAVLFAVLQPPLELVLWNHLGGYLLACIGLSVGLRMFVRLTTSADGRGPASAVAGFALAFTAAGLCHESMVVIAGLAAGIVLIVNWRGGRPIAIGRTLALLAPVLIFAVAYVFHLQRVERLAFVDRPDALGIFDAANLMSLIPRSAAALGRWTAEVALPSALTFVPVPYLRFIKRFLFDWTSPLHLVNAALCAGALVIAARAISRSHLRQQAALLVLLVGALLAYAAVICLGRSPREVFDTAYYLYVFGLLLLVFLYAVVDGHRLGGATRLAAGLVLAGFIVLHGRESLDATRAVGRSNRAASSFLTNLGRFVAAHAGEADFTFRVGAQAPAINAEVVLRAGYPDDPAAPVRRTHVAAVLFAKYYSEQSPKYVFGQRP